MSSISIADYFVSKPKKIDVLPKTLQSTAEVEGNAALAEDIVEVQTELDNSSPHMPSNALQKNEHMKDNKRTSVCPVPSCDKDKNASPSVQTHDCDHVPEMQDRESRPESHTCIGASLKNYTAGENIYLKRVQSEEQRLQSQSVSGENVEVEKVVPGMQEDLGSNTAAEPPSKVNEANVSENIFVSHSTADHVTIVNNKEKDKISILMAKKTTVKSKRKGMPWSKAKAKKKNVEDKGILWKIRRESACDLSIWRSHLNWFCQVNRGSQCLDDTYKDYVQLVKVESAVGVVFNNKGDSALDGLAISAIYENCLDGTLGITDENLPYFLSKSPLYKYDIDGAVWKKWYLMNDPSEDIHWQGMLYLRKIWGDLWDLKDYSFLLIFLDVTHPKSSHEIVTSISMTIKVPVCSRILEMTVRMLCMLYAEGKVLKSEPTQFPLSPVHLSANKLKVTPQGSDLLPVNSKKTNINATAVKSSQNANVCPSEVSSLDGTGIQTPLQFKTGGSLANAISAVPQHYLSFTLPNKGISTSLFKKTNNGNQTNNDNKNVPRTAINALVLGGQKCLSDTESDLKTLVFKGKRGRPRKLPEVTSSPRTKTTPSSVSDPKYFVPLSLGWVREIVHRKITDSTRCDIYYHPPAGKKLRSRVEIERHLIEEKMENLTVDNFTFFRGSLGYGAPFELERGANEGKYFKKRLSLISEDSSQKKAKIEATIEGVVKKSEDKNETHDDIMSDEATITNEVGETTGYEEFLGAEHETASSTVSAEKLEVPSKMQTHNNARIISGIYLKGISTAMSLDQRDTRTAMAAVIKAGEMKASNNKIKMDNNSDVVLDNKWLGIIEKYERRRNPALNVSANPSLLSESEVKDDSKPAVSDTNNGNKVDKDLSEHRLPLKLWHEPVVPLKPSTSGVNNSGVSLIKVRPLSELSANVETPLIDLKPNSEFTHPVWTYCPD